MVFKFTTFDPTEDINTAFPYSLPPSPDSTICFSFSRCHAGFTAGRVVAGKPEAAACQAKKESREEACIAPVGIYCRLTEEQFPDQKLLRRFTFGRLKIATEDFNEKNVVGKGGFGTVYKGRLSSGCLVAVKRLSQGAFRDLEEDFRTEVEAGKMVMHRNVVPLIGFCEETKSEEFLLVYPFIGNGTLRFHLHDRPRSQPALNWSTRTRIALGVARGLSYLQDDCFLRIIHRDVKTSNIMLDKNLEPRIGDLGVARFMDHKQEGVKLGVIDREPMDTDDGDHVTTRVLGTIGYADPEYLRTHQLTVKSDVYSFGVCCLELITARRPIELGKHIASEVGTAIDRSKELYGLQAIIDPALMSSTRQLRGLEKFVDLAMRCVEESGSDRPTMREVVREIENLMA